MNKLLKQKEGFTLIELLVAMAIIAILIGMTIFGVSQAFQASVETRRQNFARELQTGIVAYRGEEGTYPAAGQFYCDNDSDCTEVGIGGTDYDSSIIQVPTNGFTNMTITDSTTAIAADEEYSNESAIICYDPQGAAYALGILEKQDGEYYYMTPETCSAPSSP